MRILFLGDISGKAGREKVYAELPKLKAELQIDVAIVNAENSAHGYGLTTKIANQLFEVGADCVTTGDHAFNQAAIGQALILEPRLLRASNFPALTPGKEYFLLPVKDKKLLIITALTKVFMNAKTDCPFASIDKILKDYKLGENVDAIFLEVHGEATSEKMAMAHYFDGRISALIGTHTHVPTADARILPKGMGYLTDAGMCGDFDSVIGMQTKGAIARFINPMVKSPLTPAENEATLCGVVVEIDNQGKCTRISQLIKGPHLKNTQ
jgi:metallophosphoesterase (TIGR00282 family)